MCFLSKTKHEVYKNIQFEFKFCVGVWSDGTAAKARKQSRVFYPDLGNGAKILIPTLLTSFDFILYLKKS